MLLAETRNLAQCISCVVLSILITLNEAQAQQGQQSQQGSSSCPLNIYAGSNPKNVASGGQIIAEHDPCKGFGPQTDSRTNSRRKAGCRNAAHRLARHTSKPECKGIVHGQCAQFSSKTTAGLFDAQCFVLIRNAQGAYSFKLLVDCADGMLQDLYGRPYQQQNQNPNNQNQTPNPNQS